MNLENYIPLFVLLTSLITGVCIFFLDEKRNVTRVVLNMVGTVVMLVLVIIMLWGVFHGHSYEMHWRTLSGMDFALRADSMAILFATLSSVLWFITTIYAIGYFEDLKNRSRFFGFFSLSIAATMGIAFANNLFTFFIFYEILTLTTYPLVVHLGTEKAIRAGRIYLTYTLCGGTVLLIGIIWLYSLAGTFNFVEGGALRRLGEEQRVALIVIFFLMILGVGVKAALVPMHSWLPNAMVAPAPVSALLHAVAVVKAGAFGIVRIVYDVYGIKFANELDVLWPLAILASVTIIYGSIKALYQVNLKLRLAFSTVSQVSYIALGVAIIGPLSTTGGLVHLIHQGIMKITLFFCAGNLAKTLQIHDINQMNGVARRMPLTMLAFTIGSLGMIGVPPLAGFITKWYLGIGSVKANQPWVIAVLAISSLLNAIYFLPMIYAAWFKKCPETHLSGNGCKKLEARWTLLLPPLITAIFSLAAGLCAASSLSPLAWAKLIVEREYVP